MWPDGRRRKSWSTLSPPPPPPSGTMNWAPDTGQYILYTLQRTKRLAMTFSFSDSDVSVLPLPPPLPRPKQCFQVLACIHCHIHQKPRQFNFRSFTATYQKICCCMIFQSPATIRNKKHNVWEGILSFLFFLLSIFGLNITKIF
jgi:hypothetical protein